MCSCHLVLVTLVSLELTFLSFSKMTVAIIFNSIRSTGRVGYLEVVLEVFHVLVLCEDDLVDGPLVDVWTGVRRLPPAEPGTSGLGSVRQLNVYKPTWDTAYSDASRLHNASATTQMCCSSSFFFSFFKLFFFFFKINYINNKYCGT